MTVTKVAMLFPGQGACYPGALNQITRAYPNLNIVPEVDEVARERFQRSVSEFIWSNRIASLEQMLREEPDLLQLSIFAISVTMHRVLEAEDVEAGVFMGHSLGEIAALTCAGALSITDGAQIICDRAQSSRLATGSGYMAAITTNPLTAERLVGLVGNHTTAVAAENGLTQTVISGKAADMDRVSELARVLNIGFSRLKSPYPFHTPLMGPAQQQFRALLSRYPFKPLNKPVFSPILERYYQASDPLAELLAEHLTRPVRFSSAVEKLHAEGIQAFVEVGALDALTKLTRNILSSKKVETFAPLPGEGEEVAHTRKVIRHLTGAAHCSTESIAPFLATKDIPAESHGPFWTQHGPAIEHFVLEQYQRFRMQDHATTQSGGQQTQAPAANPATQALTRSAVLHDLKTTYAAALEYPEEVFAENTELEAELGVDSVKQTELLARVSDHYQLAPRPADFRLSNYGTLGKIADLILSSSTTSPAPASPESQPGAPAQHPVTDVSARPSSPAVDRAALLTDLVKLYATALEYPEEVLSADTDLEAELGVDSVKQTELLARVSEQYGLPPRTADFRLAHFNTLGKISELILRSTAQETVARS